MTWWERLSPFQTRGSTVEENATEIKVESALSTPLQEKYKKSFTARRFGRMMSSLGEQADSVIILLKSSIYWTSLQSIVALV